MHIQLIHIHLSDSNDHVSWSCICFLSNAAKEIPVRENKVWLYCIVLYCIVLYCIVLYCIVLYCIVLYCIVLYCIVLYCIVLYCKYIAAKCAAFYSHMTTDNFKQCHMTIDHCSFWLINWIDQKTWCPVIEWVVCRTVDRSNCSLNPSAAKHWFYIGSATVLQLRQFCLNPTLNVAFGRGAISCWYRKSFSSKSLILWW